MDVKLVLDKPPTREEITKATKVGKSPGIDGIPAEVYQHGGEEVLDKLQDLFTNCSETDFTAGPQGRSHRLSVQKQRRKIRLFKLSRHHAALNCRQNHDWRLAADMIFVPRQIQEKCKEKNIGLYAAFVYLTKAIDTVSRDGLWKILTRLSCPPKFLTIRPAPP